MIFLGCHITICREERINCMVMRVNKLKAKVFRNLGYIKNYLFLFCNRKNIKKNGVLIGEPSHGNIGDAAIAIAEHKFLEEQVGIHVVSFPAKYVERHTKTYKKLISDDMVILFHGGGFIGTLWPRNLQDLIDCMHLFPNNRIIIMPQTVFFSDDSHGRSVREQLHQEFKACSRLTLCVREGKSYEIVKKWMPEIDVRLMPDMVTYLHSYHFPNFKKNTEKKGIICCMRRDVEKSIKEESLHNLLSVLCERLNTDIIDYTDTVLDNHGIKAEEREQIVTDKLNQFASYQCVVTDRLHGMVLAAIADTPCIAFGCNNYKIEGVYEWIKNNKYIYYIDNEEKIEEAVNSVIDNQGGTYSNSLTEKGFKNLNDLIYQAVIK